MPLSNSLGGLPWRYISLFAAILIIFSLLQQSHKITGPTKSNWNSLASSYRKYKYPSPAPPSPAQIAPKEEYLALCLFIKNEPQYLPEWLDHHYHHMNVSRFYIMDDASHPPISSIKTYGTVPRSALTFHFYHDDRKHRLRKRLPQQLAMYEDCISIYGKEHTWMGFFDVDEFLGVPTTETMEVILREMEMHDDIGALAVNWRLHTSAGLWTRPPSARKAFDVCVDDERSEDPWTGSVKSIVRTGYWGGVDSYSVHTFSLLNGTKTVGEDWRPLNETETGGSASWRVPSSWDRVALHHYFLRSRAEYEEKMRGPKGDNPRTWAFWEEWEGRGKVRCTEMARYDP
jgi:hypothetical protein